jgi:predicted transcriptional regulator
MTSDSIPISSETQNTLMELAARTGRTAAELLEAAVKAYSQQFSNAIAETPAEIAGVNPADVWEAAAQADAGQLTPHNEVFARLRARP